MAKTGIMKIEDNVTEKMMNMINKGRDGRAFMMRKVLPKYRNAQRDRFRTQNDSQGEPWDDLNDDYARRKLVKYADFPGGGRKMLIATNRLMKAVTGTGSAGDAYYLATNTSFLFSVSVPYAHHVDLVRPLMEFKKEFVDDLKKEYVKWMLNK